MKLGPQWLRERRFWRPRAEHDVDDELAFHLASRAELFESSGLDPQSARDAALRRFGDLDEIRDRCITLSHQRERRMKRLELWTYARQHMRYAFRRLHSAPGFSAAVVLMLALGVGATTTVFSVVDGILLRPLPFREPERLVSLTHTTVISGISKIDQSDATFMLYQRHATHAFESIAAYRTNDANVGVTGADAVVAERISIAAATSSLFPMLRVAALRGRVLGPQDERPDAPRVALIGAALWRRKFGSDSRIVGRRIVIDGMEREVVGVMPDGFTYPTSAIGAWVPLYFDPAKVYVGSFNYTGVGRLRAGVTPDAAARELAQLLPRLFDEFASEIPRAMFEQAQIKPVVQPLRDAIVGDVGPLLWILLGAVALLLAIACANVASLFLVRAEGAQRDIAIRMALGAGRSAVVTQYLAEALLLALAGGTFGVLLAWLGVRGLHLVPSVADLPRLSEVGIDAGILAFALGATAVSALSVSLLPVLRSRRIAPGIVLKESSRSATIGRDRQRVRSALVIAQVALALVLVAGSTLMARSFAELRDVQPGFDARGVFTVRVAVPRATYTTDVSRLGFYDRVLERARALPGVRSAAVTDWLPLTGEHNDGVIMIEDHPLPPDAVPPDHPIAYAGPTYFRTLGIPLLAGRTFERADAARPSLEAIVSRSFAERYWKGQSAIGKRIRNDLSGPWSTIVGVAADVHLESLEKPAEQLVYLPLVTPSKTGPSVPAGVAITLRTAGDPMSLAPAMRAIIREIDPTLPTFDEQPMTARVAGAAARTRFVLLMLGAASAVALAMGMVGLYGVLAYGVTLRRREIGVRMALGATMSDVTRMIARRGIVLAGLGIGAGLLGALAATRFMHGLLYGVSPTDPVALAGTCLLLFAAALVASWLPARRAAALDPMEALRND